MTSQAPHLTDKSAGAPTTYVVSLTPDAFLSLGCMEGMFDSIVSPVQPEVQPTARGIHWPGYTMAACVAGLAYGIHFLPVAPFAVLSETGMRRPVSAAIIAVLIGLVLRNALALPDSIKPGCKSAVKKVIPVAIVFMGAGLNFTAIASIGLTALAITVACLILAIGASYYIGRMLGLGPKTSLLLGAGTGICGNSAIVAIAPLIDAEDDDVVLSVGTVNLLGLVAMLALPAIGGWMTLDNDAFGVWSGTSIHAVPQVVAAGFAFSPEAGSLATLVKLVRVALLAPVVCVLAVWHAKRHSNPQDQQGKLAIHYARLVPWFVWGFIAFALLNTLGLIPTLSFPLADLVSGGTHDVTVSLAATFKTLGKILLTVAMAAIGLEVNVRQLAGVGGRAITAGLFSTIALAGVSLGLICLFL